MHYSKMYPIPLPMVAGRLSIVSRPRGGDWLEDDMAALHQCQVTTLVSLLEPPEAAELGLALEGRWAECSGMKFVNLPLPDRSIPNTRVNVSKAANGLSASIRLGESVAVQCRQSVGRSSLLTVLILRALGVGIQSAIQAVGAARGVEVPETPEQLAWLMATP